MAETIDAACERLLGEVAGGSRAALGQLFAAEAGRLMAIARRIVRRRELAEEVVQESFVTIWQRASVFDPMRGSARGWLTTIVRNRALNTLRDGARLDFVDDDMLALHGDRNADAEAAYQALADREQLKRCLAQLDTPRRRSIILAYVVGYTHGEIAAELKAPVGTVKAWIRRGVTALQECLA